MTKEQVWRGQQIVEQINRLAELRDKIQEKFKDINKESTLEDVSEFVTLLAKNGFSGFLIEPLTNIRKSIIESIQQLEEELNEL